MTRTNCPKTPIDRRLTPLRVSALACAGAFAAMVMGLPQAPAYAATAAAPLAVSATVLATCVIVPTSLVFGTYAGVALSGTATVGVTCTSTTPYTVGLGAGNGLTPTATVTTRHMTGAGVNLNYQLDQDALHAVNWGNTAGTDTPASANATGLVVTLTVYGLIPAGQYVAPGAYTDSVTATVNF